MVRLTTPREIEILDEIRKYDIASKYAHFDATREDIPDKTKTETEKRMYTYSTILNNLIETGIEYLSITKEPLPENCIEIIERFKETCKIIFPHYKKNQNKLK